MTNTRPRPLLLLPGTLALTLLWPAVQAQPDTADTVPIFEAKLTADRPNPVAWDTWPGMASETLVSFGGPDYRQDLDARWTLPRMLDLLDGMGVTDVFYTLGKRGRRLWKEPREVHPVAVELAADLDEVLIEAQKREMRVWIFLNWNAKDLDFTSRAYRQTMHNLLDALALKQKQYPQLMGTWLDEIWCGMAANAYADKIATFRDFCKQEFGEEFTADSMPLKQNPADKWWRRYVVFKYCIYESFIKDYTEYSHQVGLMTIPFLVNPHRYRRGYRWGHDRYRQSKYGDFISSPTYYKNPFPVENSIMHLQGGGTGFNFTQVFRGLPVQHWASASYRDNPELIAWCREAFQLAAEWRGAEPREDVALLTYPVAFMGLFANSETVFAEQDERIQQCLGCRFATRMIDVRETRFFPRYKVLIIPRYAAYSVPEFAISALTQFVENGGTLLVLDGLLATGRRDLTDPEPCGPELTGVVLGEERELSGSIRIDRLGRTEVLPLAPGTRAPVLTPLHGAKLIACVGDTPVGAEFALGKGRVVSLYVDVARQLGQNRLEWTDALAALIQSDHTPAVTCAGSLSIQGVIRKGDRAMVSLFTGAGPRVDISSQPFQVPFASADIQAVTGTVSVNTTGLGLEQDRYQVFSLATYRTVPSPRGERAWTREQLLHGIPASVARRPGFENLVIEPPGTVHESTFLADVAAAHKEEEEALAHALAHPPIGRDPLRSRVRATRTDVRLTCAWDPEDGRLRIPLRVTNPAAAPVQGEPVSLSAASVLAATGSQFPANGRLHLKRKQDDTYQDVPLQVNRWVDAQRRQVASERTALAATDELVFLADLESGPNEFGLYVSDARVSAPQSSGNHVDEQPEAIAVDTGRSRVVLKCNGEMLFYPGQQEQPCLRMVSFGQRFFRAWEQKASWQIAARGPLETICRRRVTGTMRGHAGPVNAWVEFRLYHESPLIYLSMMSDLTAKTYFIYWPKGYVYQGENWREMRQQCRLLTDSGWVIPGFARLEYRHGYKSAVVFDRDGTRTGFGLLVASSTFPRPHTWLCEAHGLFWWQPTRQHCGTERLQNAAAEYLFIADATTIAEIDAEAERLKLPLSVAFGLPESR